MTDPTSDRAPDLRAVDRELYRAINGTGSASPQIDQDMARIGEHAADLVSAVLGAMVNRGLGNVEATLKCGAEYSRQIRGLDLENARDVALYLAIEVAGLLVDKAGSIEEFTRKMEAGESIAGWGSADKVPHDLPPV